MAKCSHLLRTPACIPQTASQRALAAANHRGQPGQGSKQDELAKLRLRLQLRGCACPDCEPRAPAYTDCPPAPTIVAGLSYRGHDASHLAIWAVSSFSGTQLQATQQQALNKWRSLMNSSQHKSTPTSLCVMQGAAQVFSDMFFLGQLPPSRLRVVLSDARRNQGSLGKSWPSHTPGDRETISLDMSHCSLWSDPVKSFQVLLHEMVHCFFIRYTCYPWHFTRLTCAEGACGKSYHINLGDGGHGRAWQYLTKAIEDCMERLLQLSGNLGRNCGFATDWLKHGLHMPCERELRRLYQWSYGHQDFWRLTRRTRDDNDIEQRILLSGMVQPRNRGRRRASDSNYVLKSARRPLESMH